MKKTALLLAVLLATTIYNAAAQPIRTGMSGDQIKKERTSIASILTPTPPMFAQWRSQSERVVRLNSVRIIPERNRIELDFNQGIAQIGIREDLVLQWEQMVRDTLSAKTGKDYSDIEVAIFANSAPIERLIPNFYRHKIKRDTKRTATPAQKISLARNTSRPLFGAGLERRHIALWPSHGLYHNSETDTWEYQRPALLTTIEDLNTYEYCYRYLIPMLENAGAVVISPRERSPQPTEIIVDNDLSHIGGSIRQLRGVWRRIDGGFLYRDSITNENPFALGTSFVATAPASIEYNTTLPEAGRYGLTVSYKALPENGRVIYRVAHSGDTTDIEVNQQMMGGSWVYLGEFDFTTTPSVTIIADKKGGTVSADAIRFGGGMGSVVRGGRTSGTPRWAEAARYSMQYGGVPSELYTIGTKEWTEDPKNRKEERLDKDYLDDFKSRGDWVNWVKDNQHVPVDLALGIHSNNGFNDTIFGTLTIHYTDKGRAKYSNGGSKYAGRDLSDIILSQITSDIRALHTPQWTRRSIYDKQYAEVSRPDVPAVIVEMFSHQEPNDMALAMDPRFRFNMSRAIYKGVLRFLADRHNRPYTVQPLPINSMEMTQIDPSTVRLSWQPTADPLEPTATPTQYKLYTRLSSGGFDNGVIVDQSHIDLPIIRDGAIRSYRITALNNGGESFPSEVLSCGFLDEKSPVVVVQNICRPLSAKVPYIHDLGYVGEIYDRDTTSAFVDNFNPGYGASHRDFATYGLSGETLDNTTSPGAQQLKQGNSYISRSAKQ